LPDGFWPRPLPSAGFPRVGHEVAVYPQVKGTHSLGRPAAYGPQALG
jgi:hypothetical protein